MLPRLLMRHLAPPVPSLPSKFSVSAGNSLSDKYGRMPPSLDTNAASMSLVFQVLIAQPQINDKKRRRLLQAGPVDPSQRL